MGLCYGRSRGVGVPLNDVTFSRDLDGRNLTEADENYWDSPLLGVEASSNGVAADGGALHQSAANKHVFVLER